MRFSQIWQSDPRYYQVTILSSLLIYGIVWLDFDVTLLSLLTIIATALLTQFFCTRFFGLPHFDFRSPLISSLSLCLLLRTNTLLLMSFTAMITIFSKFIFRWKNKHLFNPTTFGLVAMMLAWISCNSSTFVLLVPLGWLGACLVACIG